jgi:hypothetical protein
MSSKHFFHNDPSEPIEKYFHITDTVLGRFTFLSKPILFPSVDLIVLKCKSACGFAILLLHTKTKLDFFSNFQAFIKSQKRISTF